MKAPAFATSAESVNCERERLADRVVSLRTRLSVSAVTTFKHVGSRPGTRDPHRRVCWEPREGATKKPTEVLVSKKSDRRVDAAGVGLLLAATLAAFLPLLDNGFVNWDDQYALTGNDRLAAPGVLSWAFITTLMGHYQPLSWLAWSGVTSLFGVNPLAFHAASLLGHLVNTALVYLLSARLTGSSGLEGGTRRIAAFAAAIVFAVHPMRVEVVAWASAFPYILSLTWLLATTLAYLRYCDSRAPAGRRAWFGLALGSYAIALLSRVTAIGFPLVLVVLDVYPLGRVGAGRRDDRPRRHDGVRWLDSFVEKVPFALVALAAAFVESRSREMAPLEEIGIGSRLTMAATAPLVYLGRTLLPVGRSPVDPLPIAPHTEWAPLALGLAALGGLTFVCWTLRQKWPALPAAWTAYLVLLAPVMGLTPSGQTATADRYTYVPGIALSLLAGAAIVRIESLARLRRLSVVAIVGLAVVLGAATWRQTRWWHDSIALWTRAADLDPRNDIATFNLAIALDEAGRKEGAIGRYEQTLALIPDHEPARRALTSMRTERGLALTKGGRFAEAATDLRAALDARPDDLALANALAFALAQIDRTGEAVAVLKQSLARHPDNDELAHNLARVLATAPDSAVRDGALALRLALAVRDRTGGRDPRVLDTLAAAYAATGQREPARRIATEAAALARQHGDLDLAAEIVRHALGYER